MIVWWVREAPVLQFGPVRADRSLLLLLSVPEKLLLVNYACPTLLQMSICAFCAWVRHSLLTKKLLIQEPQYEDAADFLYRINDKTPHHLEGYSHSEVLAA